MNMLIEEQDVTAVNLAVELERAVIQHVLDDDGSIYVTEDHWFPFWIRVQKSQGYVAFTTYTQFKKTTPHLQRLELCNALNATSYLVTAYVQDEQLRLDCVLNYRGGLLRENFVRACRQFAASLAKRLERVDPDNDFIWPPGKTEPADEEAP